MMVDDAGVMVDKQKVRNHIDQQLQMAEAQWIRRMIVLLGPDRMVDSWGTSPQAEAQQKGLMRRIGPPARKRRDLKKVGD